MLVDVDATRPRHDPEAVLPGAAHCCSTPTASSNAAGTGQDIDAGIAALVRTPTGLHHPSADAILDRVLDPVRYDREDDIAPLAIRVEG